MIRTNSESSVMNFMISYSDQLTPDNLPDLFCHYLQKNLCAHSFGIVQHEYSPWPYRAAAPLAETAVQVLSNLDPDRYAKIRNGSSFKIKNLHFFPFRDHRRQVRSILVCSPVNSAAVGTVGNLCTYIQNMFPCLSRAADLEAASVQIRYKEYIQNIMHDMNSLVTMISTLNIENDPILLKLNYNKKLSREFLFYLGEPEISRVQVEVKEMIQAILQNYDTPIQINDTVTSGRDSIHLPADPELLNKALHAVLDNAVYHAGLVRGEVTLELSRLKNISLFIRHDWLKIAIINRGPWIAPEFLEQVTKPLFTTLKDQGRVGLGLAISDRIIRAHAGCMNVSNLNHDGVQVTIYLPLENTYA